MALALLEDQSTIPESERPAPENQTCLLPKWMYPADSPCRNQGTVFQNPDVFNIEKGVKEPARKVADGAIGLKKDLTDTVDSITNRAKLIFIVVAVLGVGYLALNVYSLVKR